MTNQQLYGITLLNYNDFLDTIIDYSDEYNKNPSIANLANMETMLLNINRQIMNYLFSVRTFLDHTEFKLKNTYGDEGAKFLSFKRATSLEYDCNFSYRFLYRLRNYSQHCGLPLGGLSLDSKEEPPFSGNIINNLSIRFSRESLLKYDGWGKQVKEEIKKLQQEFGVIPHIANFKKSLDRVNLVLINDNISELTKSAKYIEELIIPARGQEGTPIIFTVASEGKNTKLQISHIPFHLIEYSKQLEKILLNRKTSDANA
jgi:hypothetical protein